MPARPHKPSATRIRPVAESPTLFVDRSVGGRVVPEALRALGAKVVAHDEQFSDPETPDTVWLTFAGKAGWVVLTRDERIRYRPLERQALMSANTLVIVIVGGQLRGADMAALVTKAYPKIIEAALTLKRPAFLKLGRDGKLTPVAL